MGDEKKNTSKATGMPCKEELRLVPTPMPVIEISSDGKCYRCLFWQRLHGNAGSMFSPATYDYDACILGLSDKYLSGWAEPGKDCPGKGRYRLEKIKDDTQQSEEEDQNER